MAQDRRGNWDGSERRGCFYDPDKAAAAIASYLDAYQVERDERREAERFEKLGRAVTAKFLWLIGAFCLYAIGRKHEALMEFFAWFLKVAG